MGEMPMEWENHKASTQKLGSRKYTSNEGQMSVTTGHASINHEYLYTLLDCTSSTPCQLTPYQLPTQS